MNDCIFCKIIRGEIPAVSIWEDENFFAFLDINPINEGHTLIIPKKHTEYLFDLDDALYNDLFKKVKKLSKPIENAVGSERIGIIVEGFLVPHTHVHLVPLFGPGELNPEKAKNSNEAALEKLAEKIKAEFKK